MIYLNEDCRASYLGKHTQIDLKIKFRFLFVEVDGD